MGTNLALLQVDAVLIIKHQKIKSSSSKLKLDFDVVARVNMEHGFVGLFQLPMFDGYFGGWNGSQVSIFQNKKKQVNEIQSNVCCSSVLPLCANHYVLTQICSL